MSRNTAAGFCKIFEAVSRVVEGRGVRREGASTLRYLGAGVTLTRTALNEYDARAHAGVVLKA